MSGAAPLIRPSRDDDVGAIAAIYGYHVLHGVASFEEGRADGRGDRLPPCRDRLGAALPYLVAERDKRVIGYCYAGLFRPRSGYRFTLEDSIYIDAAEVGRVGSGGRSSSCLVLRATELGYRQMVSAVIGGRETIPSIRSCTRHWASARRQARRRVGFKFGRWIDIVLMQRALGPNLARQPSRCCARLGATDG